LHQSNRATLNPAHTEVPMARRMCLFALLFFASLLNAKDKAILPKFVANSKFVLVTTYFGDEPTNPQMMPDDRKAQADVEDALRKWGRYIVVYKRNEADLIILVRKGRVVEALGGIHVHHGSEASRIPGTNVGATANADANTTTEDMLTLYEANTGIDATPLWRGIEAQGLNPPEMRLVQELRSKVEFVAKQP